MGLLLLLATAAFFTAAVVYFHARFKLAVALGVVFWASVAPVVWNGCGAVGATVALTLLLAGPVAFLLVHWYDVRKGGIFYLPTIYAIPLAFLCGLALLAVATLGLIF